MKKNAHEPRTNVTYNIVYLLGISNKYYSKKDSHIL